MKKVFEEVEIEVIEFHVEDIMGESNPTDLGDDELPMV